MQFDAARPGTLQPKLAVSSPSDPLERQADSAAEQAISGKLQRKCSGCEEEDREKKVQRKAVSAAAPSSAPPQVHSALRESGAPLDSGSRGFFESRFGHDFSSIRIHSGPAATESARSVQALAYTVGRDIVFGAGQYNPGSDSGRKLLAHELAHTVQQAGGSMGLQRQTDPNPKFLGKDLELKPIPPPPLVLPGQIPEALVLPAPPDIQLTPPSLLTPRDPGPHILPPAKLQGPTFTPVTIIPIPRCVPDTPLSWADFQGAPGGGSAAAKTSFSVPDFVIQGNPMFQARLERAKSWVRPRYVNPADRKSNGCAPLVAQCRASIKAHPGSNWSTNGTPDPKCPASLVPNAVTANNDAECDTVVGAECDRVAPDESARLLVHEQTHFDIACVLVNKGNDALRAGGDLATIKKALNKQVTDVTKQYDDETKHGCDQGNQDTWVGDVKNKLPAITIP